MRSMKRLMPGAVLVALFLGCGESSTSPGDSGGGGQVPPAVLLRDVVIPNLPSPYYHFEYDATGRVTAASFASGFTMYQVIYQGDRISELRNNTLGNQDRLEYTYDGAGRVTRIDYVRPNDSVFTRLALTYAGEKLAGDVHGELARESQHVLCRVTGDRAVVAHPIVVPCLVGEPEMANVFDAVVLDLDRHVE